MIEDANKESKSCLTQYGLKNFYSPEKMENDTWAEIALDNNETAYLNDTEGWLSLQKYCCENEACIEELRIRFRDHTEVVGHDADQYMFTRGVGLMFGEDQSQDNYIIIGKVYGGTVMKSWWRVPEVTRFRNDRLTIDDLDNLDKLIHGKAKVR